MINISLIECASTYMNYSAMQIKHPPIEEKKERKVEAIAPTNNTKNLKKNYDTQSDLGRNFDAYA